MICKEFMYKSTLIACILIFITDTSRGRPSQGANKTAAVIRKKNNRTDKTDQEKADYNEKAEKKRTGPMDLNKCDFCPRTYTWPDSLKRHIKYKHQQQQQQQ